MVKETFRAAAICVGLAACMTDQQAAAQGITPDSNPPATAQRLKVDAGIDASRRSSIVNATATAAPSVVSIRVVSKQSTRVSERDAWLFGVPREQTQQSFGTGFVIREDGVVITNQHVVEGAEQITVTLPDGSDAEGRLLGEDPLTDIAVIKIDRAGLPVAHIGRSDDLAIGEWAIALGNPYSFLLGNSEATVTAGVISATGRNIMPTGNQVGRYYDMIQTDAAINPGNSGGPLVNAMGQVVGINSSIFSSSGGSVGVGFAIPIERAVRVAREIIRDGSVRRPWLGIDVAGPNRMEEWKSAGGVVVMSVSPGSPAERAGFKGGDVLTSAKGRKLRNYLDWEAVLLDLHVGDRLEVASRRDGSTQERTLVTDDLPTVTAEKVRILKGLDLVTIDPAIRAERRLTTQAGALVYDAPDAISREIGLYKGDVIIGIDRTPLKTAGEVARAFDEMKPGTQFVLWIERDNRQSPLSLVFR